MKNCLFFFACLTIVLSFQSNANCQLACTICDTKAWNTPLGDCTSGHTDLDAVEWPASSLSIKGGVSIQDLLDNTMVNPHDARPRIANSCPNFAIRFIDDTSYVGDSITVDRKWTIINKETNESHTYLQTITALRQVSNTRIICVKDANGTLLDKVKLFDTVFTNQDDCTEIEFSEAIKKITPSREDMDASGIDVVDLVMLQNGILDRMDLDEFQITSADINRDGKATGNDIVEMKKIINSEKLIEPIVWRFYNVSNWLGHFSDPFFPWEELSPTYYADISSVNQSYSFRGFKMGDIDHSYGRDYPLVSMLSKDKLLNEGEEYDLVIKVDRPHLLEGFQMDVLKTPEIEILGIDSKLPDFKSEFVADLSDRKRILWYNYNVQDGISFDKNESIIVLKIKAKANLKLSDVFKIGDSNRNKIKSINTIYPNYQFGLQWTDLSNTENINMYNTYFYPNPASDYISINSTEMLSCIAVMDLSGKSVLHKDNPKEELDITHLNQGLYLIKIQTNSGKSTIKKLFVAR